VTGQSRATVHQPWIWVFFRVEWLCPKLDVKQSAALPLSVR
jgi:hypothetical protein